MQLEKYLENNLIIIIPNNIKEKVLNYLNTSDKLYNIKLLTFNELKKELLFDYNTKTINYVMGKYNTTYSNAFELINNLYYIIDDEYSNDKLNNLLELKKELLKNNLLMNNPYFINSLKDKKILIYGFDYMKKYYKKLIDILRGYTKVIIIDKENNNYKHSIYNFNHLNNEIDFIANDIIDKDLDLNHVFIYGINGDNEETIKRVFNNYNLNINTSSGITLYETPAGKNILDNLSNFNEELEKIDNVDIKNMIIDILNKYYWESDKDKIKNMIEYEFKNTFIPNKKYKYAINQIDIFDNVFSDDDYVYIVSFNNQYIPITYKDTDYISDTEKMDYLEKTAEKNLIEKEKWNRVISNIKNLCITSSNQNLNGLLEVSTLINDFKYELINKEYTPSNHSNKNNLFTLNLLLDDNLKYGTTSISLNDLLSTYPDNNYLSYDNSYGKIKLPDNYTFSLSYSKLNSYYECAFKYYCDNVLKLNEYKETFDTWTGSLCHYILSKIYNDDFNFNETKDEYILNHPYNLSAENTIFLNKILNDLKEAITYIKSISKVSKYQIIETEKYIETYVNNVKFNGIIDKIMHYDNNVVIIDYKTGNPNIDLKLADYGLSLQLPTYVYLTKKLYPNFNIVGIYLEHILKPSLNKDLIKSAKEIYENHLKLQGYTLGLESYIKDFDPTYENSDFIKGLKLTANGFSKTSKLLSKEDFDNLEKNVNEKIEECINNIKDANFSISPKVLGQNNISCAYCPYISICFKKEKDNIYLKTNSEENDLGGTND